MIRFFLSVLRRIVGINFLIFEKITGKGKSSRNNRYKTETEIKRNNNVITKDIYCIFQD